MADKRVIEQTASTELFDDDWFLKDSVLEGTTKISKDNLIDKIGASKINSIAEDYDSTSTYNKDDFAFYENKLYKCLANNTTGTWDGTKWEEFDLPTALITTAHNIETAEFTIGTYYSADDLVLKDGKLYQCVVFHNATEWKSQFWRSMTVDTMLDYLSSSLAPEHNPSTVYAVGDLVTHNKALWRCTQGGAGSFVDANWENVTVSALIAEIEIPVKDVQVNNTGVVDNDGVARVNIDATPNVTDGIRLADININGVVKGIYTPTDYEIGEASGAVAIIEDAVAGIPLVDLKVAFNPVQSGSGDPSPENVRPIVGWDEIIVSVAGANLWDEEWELGDIDASGNSQPSSTLIRTKNFNMCKPNTTYSVVKPSGSAMYVKYYDKDKNFITPTVVAGSTITTPPNCYFIKFVMGSAYGTTYNNDISINYPSTDTSYHSYIGHEVTVDLNGTYYGGVLDVTTGVLTVNKIAVDLTQGMSGGTISGNYVYYKQLTDVPKVDSDSSPANVIAEKYTTIRYNGVATNTNTVAIRTNNYIYVNTGSQSTTPSGKAVYELATPQTVQLTPTQLSTILGQNNVFADSGNVEVKYYKQKTDENVYGSASGTIASFKDGGNNKPLKKLEVAIEPVQDLHGYDSPWVGGAGKNKCNINGGTVTSQTTLGRVTLPAGTYVASATVKNNTSIGGSIKINTTTTLATGNIPASTGTTRVETNSFTISESTELIFLVSGNASGYNYDISEIQIEVGSSATSYAPYSNICPITGYTEANVTRTGKNLFDVSGCVNGANYYAPDGTITSDNNVKVAPNFMLKKGTYKISWNPNEGYVRVNKLNYDGSFNSRLVTDNTGNITLTLDADCILQFAINVTVTNIQLELGNQVTTYEAYNGNTYEISLGDTRYGGTLDVVNGVLTVDRVGIDMGTLDWVGNVSNHHYYTSLNSTPYDKSRGNEIICSCYKNDGATERAPYYSTNNGTFKWWAVTNTEHEIYVNDETEYASVDSFKTAISGQTLCYPLATPITVTLTPTEIKTLLGANNIWADTGDINDCIYQRDLNTTINDIIARIEALENA